MSERRFSLVDTGRPEWFYVELRDRSRPGMIRGYFDTHGLAVWEAYLGAGDSARLAGRFRDPEPAAQRVVQVARAEAWLAWVWAHAETVQGPGPGPGGRPRR